MAVARHAVAKQRDSSRNTWILHYRNWLW